MARFITDTLGLTTPKAVKQAQRQAAADLRKAEARESYAREGLAAQRSLYGGKRTRNKLRKRDEDSTSSLRDTLGSA